MSPLLLALTSALLLILAFPNFNQPWCAWIALVPWLLALRGLSAGRAFRWSWLVGFAFFLGSIWWMARLSEFAGPMAVVGWLALCAYLALYFGAFGTIASTVLRQETGDRRHGPVPRPLSPVSGLLVLPCAWVALEYARSHLFSGFGWNLLAYSQAPWLPLIQLAEVTGAWGVSFVIVLVNVAITDLVQAKGSWKRAAGRDATFAQAMARAACALGVVLAMLGYGAWRLPQMSGSQAARVAVVQGNIPQQQKWDERYRDEILERYASLTRKAAQARPQLIVWPETSVPGFLGLDEPLTPSLLALAGSVNIPMLVGAPRAQVSGAGWRSANSAALLNADEIAQWHDKLHLVPFGEFIPLEPVFPWLRDLLPPIGDFVPGRQHTVFRLRAMGAELAFSVLVCFEDLFPALARRFVLEGARLLLVITNDAWFGPTAAAYQHAQASTFRAVELRIPVARAANTGWSGCIDASGRWLGRVQDAAGRELFVAGTQTCDLPIPQAGGFLLYLQWGDWFAHLCLVSTLISILINSFKIKKLR